MNSTQHRLMEEVEELGLTCVPHKRILSLVPSRLHAADTLSEVVHVHQQCWNNLLGGLITNVFFFFSWHYSSSSAVFTTSLLYFRAPTLFLSLCCQCYYSCAKAIFRPNKELVLICGRESLVDFFVLICKWSKIQWKRYWVCSPDSSSGRWNRPIRRCRPCFTIELIQV